jgi:hypothetical protein
MGFGFMLLPLSLFADLAILHASEMPPDTPRSFWLRNLLMVLAIRLIFSGVDWYAVVISMVGGGTLVLLSSSIGLLTKSRPRRYLGAIAVWLLSWVAGALPWFLAMPKGRLSDPFSIELFRAQGADVISFVVPRATMAWATLSGFPSAWPPFEFFGDGTNVDTNYLGYSLLLGLVGCIVAVMWRKADSRIIISLLVAGAMCAVLSLGPSLKIDSRRSSPKKEISQITFSDYHMKEADAVMSLPTEPLFSLYPISMMRGVYRWIIYFKLVLIVAFGWFVSELSRRGHLRWAGAFTLVALVEAFPNYALEYRSGFKTYEKFSSVKESLIVPLSKVTLPGERVFFLSTSLENDYMASWIGPKLGVLSFNGGGDKSNWIATEHMPEVIKRLKRYDVRPEQEVRTLCLLALRSGIIDKLIVPYFSLHWDSYSWPPSESRVEAARVGLSYLHQLQQDSVEVIELPYCTVYSMRANHRLRQHNVAGQVDSVASFIAALPESTRILVDGASGALTSYSSGRASSFIDYRQSDSVLPLLERGVPVYFLLTGYQKVYDSTTYKSLFSTLSRKIAFQTADYSVTSVSQLDYFRLMQTGLHTHSYCDEFASLINAENDSSACVDWSQHVDFGANEAESQVCNGWYPLERSGGDGFRWIARRATILLPNHQGGGTHVDVTVYPLVSKIRGGVQNVTIRVQGQAPVTRALREQVPTVVRVDLTNREKLGKLVFTVSIEVDRTVPPIEGDRRELGLIVSRVSVE